MKLSKQNVLTYQLFLALFNSQKGLPGTFSHVQQKHLIDLKQEHIGMHLQVNKLDMTSHQLQTNLMKLPVTY